MEVIAICGNVTANETHI